MEQKKALINFFVVLYYNDTWMIAKLIERVYNLFLGSDEISIIAINRGFFKSETISTKNCQKLLVQPSEIIFSETISSAPSQGVTFFPIIFFRFCF